MSLARNIKKFFRPSRAVVLMYHRIAEPEVDPWQLSVSRQNFREHLQVLATAGNVIGTDELITCIRENKLKSDCFCITSDDGYEDNFINAFPLIEEYKCPATFFITSEGIGSNQPYWWDMMSDIFLSTVKLPAELAISVNNKRFHYQLENDGSIDKDQLEKHSGWRWPATPPTQRAEIYLELWMQLRDQPFLLINETMRQLRKWSGVDAVNNSGSFPMTREQLLKMSAGKYINVGVHTVTHAALGAFSKDIQQTEIKGCKEFLDDNLNRNHLSIAYPYGNYNSDTLDVVKELGFRGAFTTDPGPVTIRSDVYRLGRFQVRNQTGEQFKKQIDNWLNH